MRASTKREFGQSMTILDCEAEIFKSGVIDELEAGV